MNDDYEPIDVNANFQGRKLDEVKAQKFNKLLKLAKELEKKNEDGFYVNVGSTNIDDRHRNAMVWIDIEGSGTTTMHSKLKIISQMYALADDNAISVSQDGRRNIRITFGIINVWAEW